MRSAQQRSQAAGRRLGDRPDPVRLERDARVRLMLLRVFVGLGGGMMFGSGAAVAMVRSGIVGALVHLLIAATLAGVLVLRSAPGVVQALRLDRVLPHGRSPRATPSLSPVARAQ